MFPNMYNAERNAATALAAELKAQEQRHLVQQAQAASSPRVQRRTLWTRLSWLLRGRRAATRRPEAAT